MKEMNSSLTSMSTNLIIKNKRPRLRTHRKSPKNKKRNEIDIIII